MSYWETVLVILRRWRVSIPAALVAVGLGVGAFLAVPPTYEDQAQLLFIGSSVQAGTTGPVNPYIELGSNLASTADVMRLTVSTPQMAERLAAKGATADYVVGLDSSTPAPVLNIDTKSTDPAAARRTTNALIEQLAVVLADRQEAAGAPRSTWIKTTTISTYVTPQRHLTGSVRAAILAAAGTMGAIVFVLFLLEGRRGRRRTDRPAAPVAYADQTLLGSGHPLFPVQQAPAPAPFQWLPPENDGYATNGYATNGYGTNGHDGYAGNGHANGHANGHSIGHSNGHAPAQPVPHTPAGAPQAAPVAAVSVPRSPSPAPVRTEPAIPPVKPPVALPPRAPGPAPARETPPSGVRRVTVADADDLRTGT